MDQLLQAFSSENNEQRRAAESALEQYRRASPVEMVRDLLAVYRTPALPSALRHMSLVVLRRQLTATLSAPAGVPEAEWTASGRELLWRCLPEAAQDALAAGLLEGLRAAEAGVAGVVREAAVDAVGAVCIYHLDTDFRPGGWPALWEYLQQAVMSASPEQQVSALTAFERLGSMIGENPDHTSRFPAYASVFALRMAPEGPLAVRLAALKAAVALLMFVPESQLRAFPALPDAMLRVVSDAANAHAAAPDAQASQEDAECALGSLCEMCETAAVRLLTPLSPELVALLSAIAKPPQLSSQVRRSALEVLLLVGEADTKGARRCKALLPSCLPVLAQMLQQWGESLEEGWEAEWEAGCLEDEDEAAEGREVEFAESCLDRLGYIVGKKRMLPMLHSLMSGLLGGEGNAGAGAGAGTTWQARHAALSALQSCVAQLEEGEEVALTLANRLAPLCSDPHPRVRAALQASLAALLSEQSPTFQMFTHPVTMGVVLRGLVDGSRRVRHAACDALCCYLDGLESRADGALIEPYASDVVNALLALLQGSTDCMLMNSAMQSTAQLAGAAPMQGRDLTKRLYALLGGSLSALVNASDGELVARYCPGAGGAAAGGGGGGAGASSGGSGGALRGLQGYEPLYMVQLMKGKALECLTVLGVCAGAEAFAPHAKGLLGALTGLLGSLQADAGGGSASGNPVQSYCWDALERLARVLAPQDLAPMLAHIFPPLLTSVSASVLAEEEDGEGGEEDEDEHFYGGGEAGEETVRLLPNALEDKVSAISALRGLYSAMCRAPEEEGGGASPTAEQDAANAARLASMAALLAPYSEVALGHLVDALSDSGLAPEFGPLRDAASQALTEVVGTMAHAVAASTLPEGLAAHAAVTAGLRAQLLAQEAAAQAARAAGAGSSGSLPMLEPPPPTSPAEAYLRSLSRAIDCLLAELSVHSGEVAEPRSKAEAAALLEDAEAGGGEGAVALLLNLKALLVRGCSRESFAGVPASPARSPTAPPGGGHEVVAANYFPLLLPEQLDSIVEVALGLRGRGQRKGAIRAASSRLESLELISRAFPSLTEEQCRGALEGAGGQVREACAAIAGSGVAGVGAVLEAEFGGGAEAEEDAAEAEEARRDAEEADAVVSHQAVVLLGSVLSTSGAAAMAAFDKHLGVAEMLRWSDPGQPLAERRLALYLLCDLMDHVGERAVSPATGVSWATAVAIPRLLEAAGAAGRRNHSVRRPGCYGLGLAATTCSPAVFGPFLERTVHLLQGMLAPAALEAAAGDDKERAVVDNAVSALARVAVWQLGGAAQATNRCALLESVCRALPLQVDKEEAAYMTRLLCDLLCAGDMALVGDGGGGGGPSLGRLQAVLTMLGLALVSSGIQREDYWGVGEGGVSLQVRVGQALAALSSYVPGELLQQAYALLPASSRKGLDSLRAGGGT